MHYGLLYDGFLLGIAGAAAILFVLLWWWRSDSRHLALAFLSVGASFFALVPDPLLTLNLICILLALALPFYYPSLFYFRGQPGASRLVGLSNAIFLVAHLSLAVIALAIDVVGGVPSEMMRALGAWFYIPLLLVPPAITLMAAAARERRLLFFIWVTALVVVSGYDIRAMAQKEDPAGVVFALVGLMLLVQLGHHIRRQFAAADESCARHAELRGEMEQRAAELKGLMVKAQAAGVAKTQFVSAVSHELRTPLTAIQGYTHILREEIDPPPGSVIDEFLGTIKDSCNRLILLVNDLLDMARIWPPKMRWSTPTRYVSARCS